MGCRESRKGFSVTSGLSYKAPTIVIYDASIVTCRKITCLRR